MDECIFCRIVAGEIPASLIYEDERVVAFDDIFPQAPVHALVIPREHHASLADEMGEESLGALLSAAVKVAGLKGVLESGYRVIVNNGPDARQMVDHVHIHVIGGGRMAHGMVGFEKE